MKETYEALKHMLSSIEYSKHSWHICDDLKVIAILVRLQAVYTKFFCFLCQWDSRDRKKVLHQEGVVQATVPHTGCEERRERTTSCLRKNSLASIAHKIRFDEEFC
ncbi:hypothetical protein AVEN_232845-1 [Araneus ventricosus]|uniref:Uncharacterized protein n=1 Tax=Araneus ventricosus TaxID=182803 RepID=A0A4Y2UHV8_ARAVE|nr:hypothetical protein AVEN_232845-1 [Araneus ventricosus]